MTRLVPMVRLFAAAVLGLLAIGAAEAEGLTVGKSTADQWSEISSGKGHSHWSQLAITSTDGKAELIVEFRSEPDGLGMDVLFFDRPARACRKADLLAIPLTSLLLNGKPLPGERSDSFGAGCAYEQWIERGLMRATDADVAIIQAFLDAKDGAVRLSTSDGRFDHSYAVKGFRALEHGNLAKFQRSKTYRLYKSLER